MKKSALTPARLRIVLSVVLLLLVAAGVGVFTLGYQQLDQHAANAQQVATEAEASRSSLQNLIETKKFLAENQDAVARADRLVSQSKLYYYQDQIISDINKYADEAGIKISNITFDDIKVTSVATGPAGTSTNTPAGSAPTGLKSRAATISIVNPTSYDAMVSFIHLIEQSLFRMQVSRIGMSQSSESSGQIASDALTIEVYVRE